MDIIETNQGNVGRDVQICLAQSTHQFDGDQVIFTDGCRDLMFFQVGKRICDAGSRVVELGAKGSLGFFQRIDVT